MSDEPIKLKTAETEPVEATVALLKKWNDAYAKLPKKGEDVLVWCSIKRDGGSTCSWRRAQFNNTLLGDIWYPEYLHWDLVYESDCPVISSFPFWTVCDMASPMLKIERLLDAKFGDRWREYMFGATKRDGLDMVPIENDGEWIRVESSDSVYHISRKKTT